MFYYMPQYKHHFISHTDANALHMDVFHERYVCGGEGEGHATALLNTSIQPIILTTAGWPIVPTRRSLGLGQPARWTVCKFECTYFMFTCKGMHFKMVFEEYNVSPDCKLIFLVHLMRQQEWSSMS